MAAVTVRAGAHTYRATIGPGLLAEAHRLLTDLEHVEKAFVVADADVAVRYLDPLREGLSPLGWALTHLPVPAGEGAKRLSVIEEAARTLAAAEAHRDDVVVALGGGAVGDAAGFLAATYMRGVRIIQVPTTLLAQVDASVGGKTAVNLPEGKNLMGAFHQPSAVIADLSTLATLPPAALRSGLAELAKIVVTLRPDLLDALVDAAHGLLAADPAALEPFVAASVQAKADVVAEDERDAGRRLILNYGHTLAHALERLDGFAGRSHGEAVAVGMVFAARVAERAGVAAPGLAERHEATLRALGLDPRPALPGVDDVVTAMRMDKKYAGGMRLVLLEDLGHPRVVDGVDDALVRSVLVEMGSAA